MQAECAFRVPRNQKDFSALVCTDYHPRENKMKKLVAIAMLVAFVSPALAADEFYVVQDVKTKKCTIVDKKPTTTTETTVVGNGIYKTKVEAETGMKSVKVCTTN
jgi:hypothetical protein